MSTETECSGDQDEEQTIEEMLCVALIDRDLVLTEALPMDIGCFYQHYFLSLSPCCDVHKSLYKCVSKWLHSM
jgi:hypothetical protein